MKTFQFLLPTFACWMLLQGGQPLASEKRVSIFCQRLFIKYVYRFIRQRTTPSQFSPIFHSLVCERVTLSRHGKRFFNTTAGKSLDYVEITCLNLSFTDIDTSTQSVAKQKCEKRNNFYYFAQVSRSEGKYNNLVKELHRLSPEMEMLNGLIGCSLTQLLFYVSFP